MNKRRNQRRKKVTSPVSHMFQPSPTFHQHTQPPNSPMHECVGKYSIPRPSHLPKALPLSARGFCEGSILDINNKLESSPTFSFVLLVSLQHRTQLSAFSTLHVSSYAPACFCHRPRGTGPGPSTVSGPHYLRMLQS